MKNEKYIPSSDADDVNPDFIFSLTHDELLIGIATRKIDIVYQAKRTLAGRGTGVSGAWVGFKQAAKEWKVKL